ncbi:MAG: VOC family protein [Gammaproteobacteria bacterium]|nr:VOC family protein [Gammaproteobacteria bacterium]
MLYRTHRFTEMVEWYQQVFDAEVQHADPALAFLSYDDEHHRFAIANLDVLRPDDGEREQKGLVGVDHIAYTLDSLDDLLDGYADLKEKGIKPYWCVHHGITISMYYKDPDGNQMEFQVDCFPSSDATIGFMKGSVFAANPVGVEYDPDEWLSQKIDGADLSSFLQLSRDAEASPIRGAMMEVPPGT